MTKIYELSIKTIMLLSVDAVEKAKSGHPGLPMGDATMAYVLWQRHLRHNPENPFWPGRDRFVLSAGHGSMLLYSLLHLTGHDISLDDIRNFRQWESKAPGHPEYCLPCGIETTTGPLGQGFATGVGMAIAERYISDLFNKPGYPVADYNIYGILSDGDLMEGISSEAASLAGHLKLGKIVYLYSDNRITIEGSTDLTFTEDVRKRFQAYGWHTERVDGYNIEAVDEAIKRAKQEKNRPSLIIARTHIAYGSPNRQDTPAAHGSPLGPEEIALVKAKFGFPNEPFHIPPPVLKHMRKAVEKGLKLESKWEERFKKYSKKHPGLARLWNDISDCGLPAGWEKSLPVFDISRSKMATRSASGEVLNAIADALPNLIGGSSDLAPSNNTNLKKYPVFMPGRAGRNIHFGVREHAMGAILNGMALSRMLVPYGGTFLVFSDYLRPAERLAALMKIRVIYVFTHDSIGVGEDGPTHQPVEHLASLRAMPNMTVIRPADANETREAWSYAITHKTGPVALILSRQNLPIIDRSVYAPAEGLKKGGYILSDSKGTPDVILLSSGSEVQLCLKAADVLRAGGMDVRVVSMASFEIFDAQPGDYKESVLPSSVERRLAVEAAASLSWHKYVGLKGAIIGIDRFGASAPAEVVFEKLGFTVENVVNKAKGLKK